MTYITVQSKAPELKQGRSHGEPKGQIFLAGFVTVCVLPHATCHCFSPGTVLTQALCFFLLMFCFSFDFCRLPDVCAGSGAETTGTDWPAIAQPQKRPLEKGSGRVQKGNGRAHGKSGGHGQSYAQVPVSGHAEYELGADHLRRPRQSNQPLHCLLKVKN